MAAISLIFLIPYLTSGVDVFSVCRINLLRLTVTVNVLLMSLFLDVHSSFFPFLVTVDVIMTSNQSWGVLTVFRFFHLAVMKTFPGVLIWVIRVATRRSTQFLKLICDTVMLSSSSSGQLVSLHFPFHCVFMDNTFLQIGISCILFFPSLDFLMHFHKECVLVQAPCKRLLWKSLLLLLFLGTLLNPFAELGHFFVPQALTC